MMKALLCIILICFLFSCKDKNEVISDVELIRCEEKHDDQIKISDFSTKAYLLPLETNELSLLGEVSKLVLHGGKIYVLDQRYAAKIFIFDAITGKFLSRIGTIGAAPGEYRSIEDFSIDTEKKILYTLCDRTKIITYTLSGEIIEEKNIGFYANKMEYLNDHFYFNCDSGYKYNLYVTDMNFKEVESSFPNEPYGQNLQTLVHPFQKKDGIIFFRQYLNNTIYKVNDEITPYYVVDIVNKGLPFNRFDKLSNKELGDVMSTVSCNIKYFTENENTIIYLYYNRNQPYIAVYNKKNKKGTAWHYKKFKDDYFDFEGVLFECADADKMIAVLSPASVLEQLNNASKKALEGYNITEDSNPILYIIQTN